MESIVIEYRELSEERKKEIDALSDIYDDMPKEYLCCCKPLIIPELCLCSDDEFYIMDELCRRLEYELGKDERLYYLIYGNKHVFFKIKIDLNEENYSQFGTVGGVIIIENEKIDHCENKDELLYVIGRALERQMGLTEKNDVNNELMKAVVMYKGKTV